MMFKRVFDISSGANRGFTLIEVLVMIAILGAITGIMAMTFGMVTRTIATNTAENLMMSQVNQAANWIAKDVESSSSVSTDDGTVLCSMQRYVWDGNEISGSTTVEYIVIGGILLRRVDGGAGQTVAQFIAYPDADTTFVQAPSAPFQSNTYVLKLKSVYKNGEYKQEFKMRQRAP
ncbi:MAG: type II secretion system protein [Dehalococcoidia bacterium]|jgi:type II secretory pathway component PulJ